LHVRALRVERVAQPATALYYWLGWQGFPLSESAV
jgi:hypothetical protein